MSPARWNAMELFTARKDDYFTNCIDVGK